MSYITTVIAKPQNLGSLVFWLQRSNPGSGTTWNEVQNGANATLQSATWAPQGVSFAGANTSYANGTGAALPQGATPRTIAVRFNPVTQAGAVFSWGTATTAASQTIALTSTTIVYASFGNDMSVTASTPVGTWSVVSASFDGTSNNAKLYLNGVLLGTTSHPTWNTSGTAFNVGKAVSGSNAFQGTVSDVLVYSSVLSDTAHAQLAQLLA